MRFSGGQPETRLLPVKRLAARKPLLDLTALEEHSLLMCFWSNEATLRTHAPFPPLRIWVTEPLFASPGAEASDVMGAGG